MNNLLKKIDPFESTIAKDLKLNLKRYAEGDLDPSDAALVALASAASLECSDIVGALKEDLKQSGVGEEELNEAVESAAIMSMLNRYYRFRHFISDSNKEHAAQNYSSAGLRMMSLSRPHLGQKRFEMLALAVSVINGCSGCVVAHEKALNRHGLSHDQIHAVVRLASIVSGICNLYEMKKAA